MREAGQRKDEFLAALAHALRDPLAPLRNGLHLLQIAGYERDSIEHARTMMDRRLTHLTRLVDDLTDLSRISRGVTELRRERAGLASVITSAVETCSPPSLRILVVDDNRDSADSVAMMLELMGNEICTAYDGAEAIAAAARFGPDVVLLDIGLPELNGCEAVAACGHDRKPGRWLSLRRRAGARMRIGGARWRRDSIIAWSSQ